MSKNDDTHKNLANALAVLARHRQGLADHPGWTFKKTGIALGRSTSSVTASFDALETRYNYQIAERTAKKRSTGLTPAGEVIGSYAHVVTSLDAIFRNADFLIHDGDEFDHVVAWLKEGSEKLRPFIEALDEANAPFEHPEDH